MADLPEQVRSDLIQLSNNSDALVRIIDWLSDGTANVVPGRLRDLRKGLGVTTSPKRKPKT